MGEQQVDATASNDFETWANLYVRHGAFNHPAELHGALAGQLAAGERLTAKEWEAVAADHLGTENFLPADQVSPDTREFFAGVYESVLAGLRSDQMQFRLLLPDDEAPMGERLFALSAWTRGFLEGMARVGGERLATAPEDIREVIQDFVAISQVEDDVDEEDDAENEAHWAEISEFVRVGAMTVFAEFNSSAPAPSLH